jgi:hypothetical protein
LEEGEYYVLIRTSAMNCWYYSDTVTIYRKTFHSVQTNSFCQGGNFILPDGQIVDSSGTYDSNLQTYLGCDSIVTTYLMEINPDTIYISDSIATGQHYILPDGQIADSAGVYWCTIHIPSECDKLFQVELFNIIIDEIFTIGYENNINIYPTTFSDEFKVYTKDKLNGLSIVIYGSSGKFCFKKILDDRINSVSMIDYPEGVYYISIYNYGNLIGTKILIKLNKQ